MREGGRGEVVLIVCIREGGMSLLVRIVSYVVAFNISAGLCHFISPHEADYVS